MLGIRQGFRVEQTVEHATITTLSLYLSLWNAVALMFSSLLKAHSKRFFEFPASIQQWCTEQPQIDPNRLFTITIAYKTLNKDEYIYQSIPIYTHNSCIENSSTFVISAFDYLNSTQFQKVDELKFIQDSKSLFIMGRCTESI